MKKAIIIIVILILGLVLAFVDFSVETDQTFKFVEKYKTQINYSDFYVETILSTNKDNRGLKMTFKNCQIDTVNIKEYQSLSKELAIEINQKLNFNDEHDNIILIFKPLNPEGIKINYLMNLEGLRYSFETNKL